MTWTHWLVKGAVVSSLAGTTLLTNFTPAASADAYHSVTAGETLLSIAARYGTEAENLRKLNNLAGTSDNSPLPAMLLRMPDSKASATTVITGPIRARAERSGGGTIAASMRYEVRAGDTLEAIASAYRQAGYPVTTEGLRRKNQLAGEPQAGTTLLVPIRETVYRGTETASLQNVSSTDASASTIVRRSTAAATGSESPHGDVSISGEMELPFGQIVPDHQPVYQDPAPHTQTRRKASSGRKRGPTVLSARGLPSREAEGVRILGPSESAVSVTPQPRSRSTQDAPGQPAQVLANVAQVNTTGARIRRLPDGGAVTLYRCPVSTEVAVIRRSGQWSAILMSDRSTGWMPTRFLRLTGGSVDITSQLVHNSDPWAGHDWTYNGQYSSNNPVVSQALRWLGTRYVYGGEGRRGIDCSSLVQQSFRACGYRLPRTAAEQSHVGHAVQPADLQAGDRLYFSASGSRIDHTGLYMGNGYFVHASGSGRRVMVSNLRERRNWNIFVCARR